MQRRDETGEARADTAQRRRLGAGIEGRTCSQGNGEYAAHDAAPTPR